MLLQEAEELWEEFRSKELSEIKASNLGEFETKKRKLKKRAQYLEREAHSLMEKAREAVLEEADVSWRFPHHAWQNRLQDKALPRLIL